MSEEQPEKPIGAGSPDDSAEGAAELQAGVESEDAPTGEAAGPQLGTETVDSPDDEPKAPTDGEAKDSRVGGFLKRALRWVVIFLVVFTLGIVAMQFVRVRPLTDERDSLSQSLAEAQAAQQELEQEIDRLEGVEQENQALSEALQRTEVKLALLNILVDVTRAQLALAQEDPVRVAAALQGTGDKLATLRDLMQDSDLEGIRERLVLVLSEIDADPFAAERDLEILANILLEIERELSGE
jgi:cell division protein FtsB